MMLLFWAACTSSTPDWRQQLDGFRHPDPLPDLHFVDQRGASRSLHDTHGSWTLVGFVYTRCGLASACPMTMQRLVAVQEAWTATDPALSLVAFTLDPAFDTPDVMAAYGQRFGADPERLWMLTGDEELLSSVLPGLFNVLSLPGAGDIDHTVKLALLDPTGRWVTDWTDDSFAIPALRAAIRRRR